jgi:hypothetical protein
MYDPNPAQAQERWLKHMRRGEWQAAWQISDCELQRRLSCKQIADGSQPRHLQSIWDGRSLIGRRVLVRCYHGLGDTVQFVRLMPMLRQQAAQVVVWAQAPLLPLLRTAGGIDRLIPLSDGHPDMSYDTDIEIMELPHALRLSPATVPAEVPYFDLGTCAAAVRQHELPRVGIVWQSGGWDPRRSVPQALMEDLLQLEGVTWLIFQRGPALNLWPRGKGQIPSITNIMDEALAMRSLDLLISVDTLSAHLAGALGVPTWTLIPAVADWRWMQDREDSPWYPTMRLFRQDRDGDWEPVIARVHATLESVLARRDTIATGRIMLGGIEPRRAPKGADQPHRL